MPFSQFLNGKRSYLKQLVAELGKSFKYVSVLGTDVKSKYIGADKNVSRITETSLSECGFVVKMHNGNSFCEYSFDSVELEPKVLAQKILASVALTENLAKQSISCPVPEDAHLVESFLRESDFESFPDEEVLAKLTSLRDELLNQSDKILNAFCGISYYEVNKLFVSANRELDQHYGWCNGFATITYRDGKVVVPREFAYGNKLADVLAKLPEVSQKLLNKAQHLVKAQPVVPGVYDVITAPSITGLIAHEAFGHGVEMDQFVKDRALAKKFMNDYVASPICNMRDGAAATLSCTSYFFDDDGVLAHDTQIIKDGVLVSGISDLTSAQQLGTEPTGNGRRESFKRKAYTRMTNTFFDCGTDKLEDMIASVKHGYMIFETNNGMEDPKNWQIQCTAEYGIEIVDGKLTENWVSPVVISGSVPELLKSISMISDQKEVIGSGSCGKGYKEWVRVSDGGPCLKARAKLA